MSSDPWAHLPVCAECGATNGHTFGCSHSPVDVCPTCQVPGGAHRFDCPDAEPVKVGDDQLPDALDVARRLCEHPWDDLQDEVKLMLVTRAQQYIDVIAPPLIEQRERARAWAVEIEQQNAGGPVP